MNKYNNFKISEFKFQDTSKDFREERKKNPIIGSYIKDQEDFCLFPEQYKNDNYEGEIIKTNVNLMGIFYYMYVLNIPDIVSESIKKNKNWEVEETKELVRVLEFYKIKNNIVNREDIMVIDIGANVGWYTTFLAHLGYSVISFEAGKRNNYILKKNYCLNNYKNIIVIDKGLYNVEKYCKFEESIKNYGDGYINCNINNNKSININYKVNNTNINDNIIKLTKLSNFIPFLKLQNIALIKLDVEGSEGKILQGGLQLLTKYHVPFIFTEFGPKLLKAQNTSSKEFLKLFYDNGYQISTKGFLCNQFKTLDEIIITPFHKIINLYVIHKSVFD